MGSLALYYHQFHGRNPTIHFQNKYVHDHEDSYSQIYPEIKSNTSLLIRISPVYEMKWTVQIEWMGGATKPFENLF